MSIIALDECLPGLSTELAQAVKTQHLSTRTSHTYQHWIGQYLAFYDLKTIERMVKENKNKFKPDFPEVLNWLEKEIRL